MNMFADSTPTSPAVVWEYMNYIKDEKLYRDDALASAVFEERQRIARELHDSVLQVFYGINMIANHIHTMVDTDPYQAAASMKHVSMLTETGINEVRALLYGLRPDLLETEGLMSALHKRVAMVQECYNLHVETSLCDEPPISIEQKHALYCITQEALNNVVKHAHASNVTLQLTHEEQALVLVVSDDGKGFHPNRAFPGHLGLQSLRQRAALLGSPLFIESTPGQGTSICVRLPY